MKIKTLQLTLLLFLCQAAVVVLFWDLQLDGYYYSLFIVPVCLCAVFTYRAESSFHKGIKTRDLAISKATNELDSVRKNSKKDQLTTLGNRNFIEEQLDFLLAKTARSQHFLAVLHIDIDYFKEFNDALGHKAGDDLLRKVAQRLKSIVKKGDILAHLSGDEFVVVLPVISSNAEVEQVASRIIAAMSHRFKLDGRSLTISISIGISIGPLDGKDSTNLMHNAESALKVSKANGRKRYSFCNRYTPDQASSKQAKMDQLLRFAMDKSEMSIFYQPIVSGAGEQIKGFEALLRWTNQELGQLSPAAFIPIAEQTGLISELGAWVLREAVSQLKFWQLKYDKPLVMSINVSPRQVADQSIVPALKQVIKSTGVKPEAIQLEVTEGLFLQASEETLRSIQMLKGLGVKLALDDFGTGFSSLAYLNKLPFDAIKIDRSFVERMVDNEKDRKMVQAIISIASDLSMEAIIEGVETLKQVELLRKMSADALQGYYYSQPLPAKEAESLFLAREKIMVLNETVWDQL